VKLKHGDVHRLREIFDAGVDIAAAQLVLVRKADGVDDEIEASAQRAAASAKTASIDPVGTSHSGRKSGAQRFGERPHALFERLALIGEGEARRLRARNRLRDAPGAIERSLATPMIRKK
jgi:hypothetical protein